MYSQSMLSGGTFTALGDRINNNENFTKEKRQSVFLESALFQANQSPKHNNQIVPILPHRKQAFDKSDYGIVYRSLKPVLLLCRSVGLLPISYVRDTTFKLTTFWLVYSATIFLLIVAYMAYITLNKIETVRTAEGRFEEAVIDYLFTVYLIPIVMCPLAWYENRNMVRVFNDWNSFERIYKRVTGRVLPLHLGNKPLFLAVLLPILAFGTMIVTHITMAHFYVLKVLPYCYVNTLTYLIGGLWYIHCDAIGKIATVIADDFEITLRHIGPSTKVADYRSLWMLLSRISRSFSNSFSYVLIFLCLYLFLVITLTIYGLLSQIQEGFGIKDIGLTITAGFAIALLYFVCDEAHYASSCVSNF